MKRRTFIKTASLAGAATMITKNALSEPRSGFLSHAETGSKGPIILSTWDFGKEVPQSALKALEAGGTVVDAVEKGVMVPEADPKVTSVGYGGFPDRDGKSHSMPASWMVKAIAAQSFFWNTSSIRSQSHGS